MSEALFAVTERLCRGCQRVLPLASFYLASERRQTAQKGRKVRMNCRECTRKRNEDYLRDRRALVDDIKTSTGCADCGLVLPDHPEIYDFDHRPGEPKVASVAKLMTKGTVEQILEEIAKCDVVCANCHRIRTRERPSNAFGVDRGPRTA